MEINHLRIDELDAEGERFGIVAAMYYEEIVSSMITSATDTFEIYHADAVDIWYVPGVYEIPIAAQQMALTGGYDALLTLGCVIRGETKHFDLITEACSRSIMQIMLQTKVPIALGILAVDDITHADERTKPGSKTNRGREYALTALQMAKIFSVINQFTEMSNLVDMSQFTEESVLEELDLMKKSDSWKDE